MLHSVDLWLATDVSGQPIGPLFKSQAVHEEYFRCGIATEYLYFLPRVRRVLDSVGDEALF